MKRKTTNKKVLQAISIGLSAMIAVSSIPMDVQAAETTGTAPDDETTQPANTNTLCDTAQDKVETALEEIGTKTPETTATPIEAEPVTTTTTTPDKVVSAYDAVEGVENKITEGTGSVVAGEAGLNAEGEDLSQKVLDAATNLDDHKTPTENVEDPTMSIPKDGEEEIQDAYEKVDGIQGNLAAAEADDDKAALEQGKANTAVDNAQDAVDEMDNINKTTGTAADTEISNMQNATTIADANAAYNNLQNLATKAEADFDAQLSIYAQNKADLEKALADKQAAEADYQKQIASASTSATDAYNQLKAAEAKVADLETALADAEAGIKDKYSVALQLAEEEEKAINAGTSDWTQHNKLFKKILTDYVIPTKLGGTTASVELIMGEKGSDYNVFKATYTDQNGEEVTKYFDYKKDSDKNHIVIYEERANAFQYAQMLNGDSDAKVDKDDYDHYTALDSDGHTVNMNGNSEGVDYTKYTDTLEKAKEEGRVVEIDGKYIYLNEGTTEELFTSQGPTKDVTTGVYTEIQVGETKSDPVYKIEKDEDGNEKVVSEVTADVTTITYVENTFNSTEEFTTSTAAADAAAAKKADLEKDGDKVVNVAVSDKQTANDPSTYTATGYYIPTFTTSVTINHKEDYWEGPFSGNNYNPWYDEKPEGIQEAKNEAYNNLKDKQDIDEGGLYMLPESVIYNNVTTVDGKGKGDYTVTGTATATYAKISKTQVELSTIDAILSDWGWSNTKENTEKAAKKWVEEQYGIFVQMNTFNWNFASADVYYVAAQKLETEVCNSSDDAITTINNQVNQLVKETESISGMTKGYITKNQSVTEQKYSHDYYTYSVDYLEKTSSAKENTAVEKTTYYNANAVTGTVEQDLNYKNKNYYLVQQTDEDYRTFVDSATAAASKYADLKTEAATAKKEVSDAEGKVTELRNELSILASKHTQSAKITELLKLLKNETGDLDNGENIPGLVDGTEETQSSLIKQLEDLQKNWQTELDGLEENSAAKTELQEIKDILDKLIEAEKGKQSAQDVYAELVARFEAAGEDLEDIIDRLTPPATQPGEGGETNPGGGDVTPGTYDGTTGDTTPTAYAVAAAAETIAVNAPAGQVLGAQRELNQTKRSAKGKADSTLIEELDKASGAEDLTTEEKKAIVKELQDETKQDLVTIDDEDVALAATLDQKTVGWWWWLIIVAFGAAGVTMYKKHMDKKKAAKAAVSDEE